MKQLLFGLLMLIAMSGVSAATFKFEFHASEFGSAYPNDFFGQIDPGELLLDLIIEAERPYGLPDVGPNGLRVEFLDENRYPSNPFGRITSLTAYNWGRHPPDQHDSVAAIFNPTVPQTGPQTGPDTVYDRYFHDYLACTPYPTCTPGTDNSVDRGDLNLRNFLMPIHRDPASFPPNLVPYDLFTRGMTEMPGRDLIQLTNVFHDSTFIEGDWTYSVVPIPATVWLFGTGILGLIGFSRRRKAG